MLNGLVGLKQRGRTDLGAEISDSLIPGQKLKHIIQGSTVEPMYIGFY